MHRRRRYLIPTWLFIGAFQGTSLLAVVLAAFLTEGYGIG